MIYKYTLTGKIHNSDRIITSACSIPMGLSTEDFWTRAINFGKAFKLIKLEVM